MKLNQADLRLHLGPHNDKKSSRLIIAKNVVNFSAICVEIVKCKTLSIYIIEMNFQRDIFADTRGRIAFVISFV